jgi:molybdopterin-guanine dinucleotide biosynthesis protein A
MNKTSDTFFASRVPDASAAVIAGGKSTRFGSPKAAALLLDKKLIDYAIQIGYRLSREVFLVTASTVPYENPFAPAVQDIYPNCGPLGGILTALTYSSHPFVCTLPCDMPLMSPDVFRIMKRYRTATRPVVARSERGLETLLAIWPVSVWNVLYTNIRNDQNSIRLTLKELEATEVDIPEELPGYNPQLFTNINFKEDLRRVGNIRPAI